MRDDFRVGLAGKHIALRFQLRPQVLVVFDNAVMDDRHLKA